jgi:hypothetical protein
VILNWQKGSKDQHLTFYDKFGKAESMGRNFPHLVKGIQGLFRGMNQHFFNQMNEPVLLDLKWITTPNPDFVRENWPSLIPQLRKWQSIYESYCGIPGLNGEQAIYADKMRRAGQEFTENLAAGEFSIDRNHILLPYWNSNGLPKHPKAHRRRKNQSNRQFLFYRVEKGKHRKKLETISKLVGQTTSKNMFPIYKIRIESVNF